MRAFKSFVWRMLRPVVASLLALGGLFPNPAPAQLPEGISLGIMPTVERVEWDDDVLLDDADLWGGRVALNFGRFVALQGYLLREWDEVDFDAGPGSFEIDRRGADLVLTAATTRFTPFVRLGAGVIDFEGPSGVESEHLTATLGGGLKFDLFERLQTQVFVHDLALRATRAPFLVETEGEDPGLDERTFHNLSYGLGLSFFLGGESVQPETDEALLAGFRGGLGGVAIPIEVFGGELSFDDDFDLEDQNVAGVRAGLNLGPYVGVRGIYLRGVNDDLDDFEEFEGYGGEASFNLNRGEGFTPYLVVGLGRLHFTDAQVESAALLSDKKWAATAGAGLAFNVSPRFRLEAAARNLLLAEAEAEDVTAPDELKSNWLFSGGLRFAIGGTTADVETVERERSRRERDRRDREQARRERGEPDEGPMAKADLDRRAGARDTLETNRRGRPVETIEIPVLDRGEIYIRYGESGTFERAVAADSIVRIRVEGDTLVAPVADRDLAQALERIDGRLDEIDDRLGRLEDRPVGEGVRVEVEERPAAPVIVEREEAAVEEERVATGGDRGVFEGEPIRVTRLAAYGGASVNDPQQILLGINADVGSAFGGRARFVPELTFGFIDDTSLTLNGHLEWVFDREYRDWRPYAGTGLGLFVSSGELEIFIPNFFLGAIYAAHDYQPFAVYQGLDLFDDNRFLVGIRRF
ncbi:MAG: outer membrane beta-barrel protein [Gemmatimonadota bacterium]